MNSLLKEGMRGSRARNPLRSALVAGQVAITLMLLAGAGLLMRSFYEWRTWTRASNRTPDDHASRPPAVKYRGHPDLQIQLARNILGDMAALPGVRQRPLRPTSRCSAIRLHHALRGPSTVTPSQAPLANYFAVTPGFFDAMGMHLKRGRPSPSAIPGYAAGGGGEPDAGRSLLPARGPIGKRLEIGFSDPPRWREIVGVVADVKAAGLDQDRPCRSIAAHARCRRFLPAPRPP